MSATQSLLCLARSSPFITLRGPNVSQYVQQLIVLCYSVCCHGMALLIFIAAETGVCMPLLSKLTSASDTLPAFKPCLPSRCLAMDYSIKICFDSQVKQLFPFLVVFYSTFVIMYPNNQSYMQNDSVNIEKHIKTYLLNTRVFNVNSGNQGSPMTFSKPQRHMCPAASNGSLHLLSNSECNEIYDCS
jgi:hypothetical protein